MAITIADLTAGVATDDANVVTGTGVFDDMMETVNAHMAAQFNLGRITGSDYATVYLTVMQATIQQAVAYTIGIQKGNSEEALLLQKEVTEFAQTDRATKQAPTTTSIMGAAAALSVEQAKGFKWNADQKYLKTLLDAWSINTSTAGVPATQVTAINASGTDNINDHIANAEPTG
mgnify:CR=1 FL=1|tara:strand:- start:541 stop:1065 length:525 start_codon:yes stop_codon:yes gene_type:complete